MTSPSELRDLAVDVAQKAGAHVLARRQGHIDVAHTKSSVNDVVTEVDKESEQLIFQLLSAARPDDGFFGEEGQVGLSRSGITWVVDPIDGTVNFLYGIPHYAISIAAVMGPPHPAEWTVLAGVVFNPATGELFHAAKGVGSFLGSQRLSVAEPVPIENALWLTGFAYSEKYRRAQGELLASVIPLVRDIRRMGTASLDLAAIAAGRANVYFERTLSPWDHAAGELLVTEAGGVIRGFGEETPSREALFAGHPHMVEKFQQLVSANGGDVPLEDIR
jgi:myo-inositol-1(or 4)-monophosphatase